MVTQCSLFDIGCLVLIGKVLVPSHYRIYVCCIHHNSTVCQCIHLSFMLSRGCQGKFSLKDRQQLSFWQPCRHKAACHVLLRLWQLLDPAVSLPPGAATGCCSRQSYRLPGSLYDGLVPHALELWPAVAWAVHATNSTRCALLLLC